MRRLIVLLVVCLGLVGAVSQAQAHNLQPLGPAPGPCTPGQTTPCTFNSRCAQMTWSPHLVHVGEEIESSAGPAVDACGPGGVRAISWSWGAEPGLTAYKGPCRNTPLTQPSSCTFKADGPTETASPSGKAVPGFAIGCINGGSGFGSWMSCDYYGVIGAKERAIDGRVLTKSGKPVNGVTISIEGPSGGTVQTDSNGSFDAVVDPGHYRVTAVRVPDTVAFCSGGQSLHACNLDLTHTDGQADFTAPPDTIELHFSPSSVRADGLSHFDGTIDVTDSAGQPAAGTELKISPPLELDPRALVCAGGKVIYPQLPPGGTPLGSPFTMTADANGQLPLSIWPGTIPGHWFTEARETADMSVSNGLSFPFDAAGNSHFPPADQLPTTLYNAVRASGNGALKAFWQSGSNTTEAENQDIFLNWLLAFGKLLFPGTDFGPVAYAGHAGVLFYPQGSSTPTAGPTGVIDLRDAVEIVTAAASGAPIPPANNMARPLDAWARYVSGSSSTPPLAQTLGPAAPWTGEQYAYFGFPYPRSALDAAGQAEFYNQCAAPDGGPQVVSTHSPVTLVFTSAAGTSFGLDASGNHVGTGTGIIFRKGEQTTYVVPGGRYSAVHVTGTGSGPAHIDVYGIVGAPTTTYARQISDYTFAARPGVTGALPINFFGPAGAFVYAGRSMKPGLGLPIALAGVPTRLRHGKRTLKLVVTSFGAPVPGATVALQYKGHELIATTDARGRVRFKVKLPKGKLTIAVTAAGTGSVVRHLHVG